MPARSSQDWISVLKFTGPGSVMAGMFEGMTTVARGSVTDKPVPLLAVLREAQTPEQFAALVAEGHSPVTTRNAIHNDPRFVRSAKNEFGISVWDLETSATQH